MLFLPGTAKKGLETSATNEPEPDTRIFPVTGTVKIMYDLNGGWFGLVDDCGAEYEQPGAVAFGLKEIDLLIVALGELRKQIK